MSLDVGPLGVRRYPTSGPIIADVNFRARKREKPEQFNVCQSPSDVK